MATPSTGNQLLRHNCQARPKDHLDAESRILEIEDFGTGNYLPPLPLFKPKSCSENKFVQKVVNIPKPTGYNIIKFIVVVVDFLHRFVVWHSGKLI